MKKDNSDNIKSKSSCQTDVMANKNRTSASAWDILNSPVGEAVVELVKKGAKVIRDIGQTTKDIFQSWSDEEYTKMCRPILTMDDCVNWLKLQRPYYPTAGYFFVYVEKNPMPRNVNDLFSVTLALLDKSKKAIFLNNSALNKLHKKMKSINDGQDIVCIVIPTRTIDDKLINALNGTESVLIKL